MPTVEKAEPLTMHDKLDDLLRGGYQHLRTLDEVLDALRPCDGGESCESMESKPSSSNLETKLSELSDVLGKIGQHANELQRRIGNGKLLQAQVKSARVDWGR